LGAHGYYQRYVTGSTKKELLIAVRRFKCRSCTVTVSCLPSFAQPYKLVNNDTITDGFNGKQTPLVERWAGLIASYLREFESHLPELVRRVGNVFGPLKVNQSAQDFWLLLIRRCRDLGRATAILVEQFHTCLFGTYRCHQRRC